MPRAVIFVNGNLPDPKFARELLKPEDLLIAADGGTRHLLSMGLLPAIIVGDLDSLAEDEKNQVAEGNVRMIPFPADKNETDLELALDYAVKAGCGEILLVGALGKRLDQTLGNLAMMTNPSFAQVDLRMDDGVEQVFFTRDRCVVHGQAGDTVSLVPWGCSVTGITTTGLHWSLKDEDLSSFRTRGISNRLLSEKASISIKSGLLLVIHRRK